jgi:hypothetical protein
MGGLVLVAHNERVEIGYREWRAVLTCAQSFGWRPTGTHIDGAGPYWCGAYVNDGYHGVSIGTSDAAGLSAALLRAMECGETLSGSATELAAVASLRQAECPVDLSGADVYRYCHCEMQRRESPPFDGLNQARTSPWVPQANFDCYSVFAAVRAQVHEPCWARHPETREALAQAVCGYLDHHPEDASLSDSRLLTHVQQEFYARNQRRFVPEDGSGPRANGGYLMLRNAQERRSSGETSRPGLAVLASQGPWWRAARILGDNDIALIAAGVEWLYQHQAGVNAKFVTFGPHEDPPRAEIPTLDFERVQQDIFGPYDEYWPGQDLAAYQELTIADVSDESELA